MIWGDPCGGSKPGPRTVKPLLAYRRKEFAPLPQCEGLVEAGATNLKLLHH